MTKTINVEEETWSKLTILRVQKKFDDLNALIEDMLKKYENIDWYQHFYDDVKKRTGEE